ncbi:prepilin-type N-terminal cleavage/methylation domain-containing protein [Psychrobacillus sp. FSL K6-2365]|uniref:prepilin-type N-terminal cleavage/methylation domain-containing protein n=1 Tax=Psychrobacillus sp. FSL K6-2365 TaxID=2921546 RepID=UPI0030F64281
MMNEMNELNESNEITNKGANHMKKMKQLLKNQKGMTLIELLAVIVILAIVAAIAVPAIGNIIENSRYNAVKADATNVLSSAQLYFTDNSSETEVNIEELIDQNFLESEGKIPTDAVVKKASPNTLTTNAIDYSGSKKVTFNNATLKQINDDDNKGSEEGPFTIGTATTTP